jgi:hypothetical protein
LLRQQSAGLLEVLRQYIPNLKVVQTRDCPRLNLRGISTLQTPSDPAIYVAGQRAASTCILTQLNITDVERVEVYPSGIPRGAYQTDPYGVILVIMRTLEP